MANLVTFGFNDETFRAFGRRFTSQKEKQVRFALTDIKREWQADIVKQHKDFQGTWSPLSRRGKKSYYNRKLADFNSSKHPEVKYFTILQRTGRMLDGYINGMRVDDTNFKVTIPYPISGRGEGGDKTINTRAKVHQGIKQQPAGSLGPRPFSVQRFKDIAVNILTKAIQSDPKSGPYRGTTQHF